MASCDGLNLLDGKEPLPCDQNSIADNVPSSDTTDLSGEEGDYEDTDTEEDEHRHQPFFDDRDGVAGRDVVATVQKRPSYLNLGGSTGLLPSTHPFNYDVVKKLDSVFDESIAEVLEEEKLKTFLRIRSTSAVGGAVGGMKTKTFKSPKNKKVLEIKDDMTVIAYPLQKSLTSCLNIGSKKGGNAKKTEFKFSKVLGPESGQSAVFDECVNPLIEKFLKNENCLIFTYGATNSGKTYTLQGSGVDYGIIPRSLYVIFNRIQDRLVKNGDIMPHLYQTFRHLTAKEIQVSKLKKERILAEAAAFKNDFLNLLNYSQTQSSSRSESSMDLVGDKNFDEMNYALFANNTTLFSVWISYAELYNERVYDLLETVYIGQNKRRKELKLLQDRNGFVYVKDLTEIHVTSEQEAYKIFLAGRQYLQFGATQMNLTSSRSHSFFTLRVVTIGVGEGLLLYPKSVHRLTFCDLAGMERVHQTENAGVRLKESSNINASLTVLLKVIRILREKQIHRNMIETIPFRESKLTHIFKGYFTSSTHICMIVNVNPDPTMANATLQVLRNSAIASNVIVFKPLERNNNKQDKKELKDADLNGKSPTGFVEHKNQLNNEFDSTASPEFPLHLNKKKIGSSDSLSTGSNSDEEAPPSIVVRNRLLHERVAILERENLMLRRKLMDAELEKERIREESVKIVSEQNRLWGKRFKETKLQEEMFTQRRLSLMRQQLALSPGSKCGRSYTPPVLDMDSILEEDDETEMEEKDPDVEEDDRETEIEEKESDLEHNADELNDNLSEGDGPSKAEVFKKLPYF